MIFFFSFRRRWIFSLNVENRGLGVTEQQPM